MMCRASSALICTVLVSAHPPDTPAASASHWSQSLEAFLSKRVWGRRPDAPGQAGARATQRTALLSDVRAASHGTQVYRFVRRSFCVEPLPPCLTCACCCMGLCAVRAWLPSSLVASEPSHFYCPDAALSCQVLSMPVKPCCPASSFLCDKDCWLRLTLSCDDSHGPPQCSHGSHVIAPAVRGVGG
jgi:hypothetical protein